MLSYSIGSLLGAWLFSIFVRGVTSRGVIHSEPWDKDDLPQESRELTRVCMVPVNESPPLRKFPDAVITLPQFCKQNMHK